MEWLMFWRRKKTPARPAGALPHVTGAGAPPELLDLPVGALDPSARARRTPASSDDDAARASSTLNGPSPLSLSDTDLAARAPAEAPPATPAFASETDDEAAAPEHDHSAFASTDGAPGEAASVLETHGFDPTADLTSDPRNEPSEPTPEATADDALEAAARPDDAETPEVPHTSPDNIWITTSQDDAPAADADVFDTADDDASSPEEQTASDDDAESGAGPDRDAQDADAEDDTATPTDPSAMGFALNADDAAARDDAALTEDEHAGLVDDDAPHPIFALDSSPAAAPLADGADGPEAGASTPAYRDDVVDALANVIAEQGVEVGGDADLEAVAAEMDRVFADDDDQASSRAGAEADASTPHESADEMETDADADEQAAEAPFSEPSAYRASKTNAADASIDASGDAPAGEIADGDALHTDAPDAAPLDVPDAAAAVAMTDSESGADAETSNAVAEPPADPPPPLAERQFSTPDGLELFYRDYAPQPGEEDVSIKNTPVLCLAGLTRNGRDFSELAPRLAAAGRRVIVADQRGRGQSDWDANPEHYQASYYVGDMLSLLDAVGVGPVIVVGTSLGGIVAMMMAAAQPGRIAGAVLNDIGPELAPEGLERIAGYVAGGPPAESWEMAAGRARAINGAAFPTRRKDPDFWEAFARRLFRETPDGQILLDYDPNIAQMVLSGRSGPSELWSFFDALKDIPTLAIRGELSDLLTAEALAKMQLRKPDLRTAETPAVGHAPLLDEPEAWAALESFLTAFD